MNAVIQRILLRILRLEQRITIGPVPPENPRLYDIWIDIS